MEIFDLGVAKKEILFINHPDRAKESADKFKVHFKFNGSGIPVAKTALVGARDDARTLGLKIKYVSSPFVLGRADGAYGNVATHGAQSLDGA